MWIGGGPRRCSDLHTEPFCVWFMYCRNGLFTELMNSECMTDRDYQGWVDFGRRDTEWGTSQQLESWRTAFLFRFYKKVDVYFPCNFRNKQFCRFIALVFIPYLWWWVDEESKVNLVEMKTFIHRWYSLRTHWHVELQQTTAHRNSRLVNLSRNTNLCLWILPF